MRATPPAARMSAGTRSSAMTATAPASSAILRLLGGDDVHDDAALEHLGEALLGGPGGRFDGHVGHWLSEGRVAGRAGPACRGVLARSSRPVRRQRGAIIARSRDRPCGTRYRPTVRTTPDISFVARRAAVGDRRLSVSTRPRTSSSGRPSSKVTSLRTVSSGTSPRSRSARSSSRGSKRGTSPTARSKSRTKTRNVASHSRQMDEIQIRRIGRSRFRDLPGRALRGRR